MNVDEEEDEEKQKRLGVDSSMLYTMNLQSNSWKHIKNFRHYKTNGEDLIGIRKKT